MKPIRITLVLLALAALTGAAAAESPWQSLARKISPQGIQSRLAPASEPVMVPAVGDEMGAEGVPVYNAAPALSPSPQPALPNPSKAAVEAMQKKANDIGLESQDNPSEMARNLFDNPEIRRLLGDNPRFIYNPAGKPDPMLVPWVRDAVIFEELSMIAAGMLANNQTAEAKQVYHRIIEMKNPRYTVVAQACLAQIMTAEEVATTAAQNVDQPVPEAQIQLPEWVNSNTSGVIVSPGRNLCLVGDFMLHVGDNLPNYPEVTVAGITSDTVTYSIRNKVFEVHLNSSNEGLEASWQN
jgi:hypothetical protein